MGIINKTCELAGIERINPDNIDLEDWNVWNDIRQDTSMVFQMESPYAAQTMKQIFSDSTLTKIKKAIPDIKMLKLMSYANALIRPCGASVREESINGIIKKTGIKDIDDLLAPELGNCIIQEDIMLFLMKFCGFDLPRADYARKCIAENSLITMADGSWKRIQDIKIGDKVLSLNPKTKRFVVRSVIGVYDNGYQPTVSVFTTLFGNTLRSTIDHKYHTKDGFVPLKDIKKGTNISVSVGVNWDEDEIFRITPYGVEHVYDIEVEDTHNYIANGIVVHNCIAKKKGTEQLMPEIEKGFNENAKVKYNLSEEKANEIIKPVLKCILDATRYAFSWNHSDAYSFIGYACGYLKHYYPLEFLTTCLNVWQDKIEKTAMVTSKIAERGYKIAKAQFRMSRAEYFCDKNTGTIYKGLKSIKYLNENVAEILYSFRDNKYNSFTELLYDISKTNINARQMGVLIDIDFFAEFGNAKQLKTIYNTFDMFKQGNAKLIKRDKLANNPILDSIVSRYSKQTATNYTQLDCVNILKEAEQYVICSMPNDYPISYKLKMSKEYLGYIDYKTDKPEDRPKILIQSIKRCIGKFGKDAGKPWCYMLDGYSLGSGKVSTYSIFTKQFDSKPVAVDDIIYIDEWHRNNKGYFYIDKYKILPKNCI